MACYFIIKNIKGGEDKIIPAFNLISPDDKELKKLMKDSLDAEELKELKEYLRKNTPLHSSTVDSIVNSWNIKKDNLILNINEAINNSGSQATLEKAIFDYLKEDKANYQEKFKGLIKFLSIRDNSIKYKLFSQLSTVATSLGSLSLSDEISSLSSEIAESKTYFQPTFFEEEMNKFLRAANEKLDWNDSKTLLKVGGSKLNGGYWNFTNFTVYAEDPFRANLFLALFKRIAGNLDQEQLTPIFKKINLLLKASKYDKAKISDETVSEYFNGKYDEEKGEQLEKPKFDSLFEVLLASSTPDSVKTQISGIVEEIILMVSEDIKKGKTANTVSNLEKTIKNLFWRLYPESFGSDKLKEKLYEEEKLTSAVKKAVETSLRDSVQEFNVLSKSTPERVGELYEIPNKLSGDNLYQKAIDNLIVGRDLVKLPFKKGGSIDKYSPYWILTGIYERKDGSVKIYGARINQNGDFEKRDYTFTGGKEYITFRKHNPIVGQEYYENDVYIPADETNAATVIFKEGIPSKLARELITKGDKIYNYEVVGVYPGYLLIRTPDKKIEKKFYKNILAEDTKKVLGKEEIILSKNALEIIKEESSINFNSLSLLNDPLLIQEGDYFKLGKEDYYKKALFIDEDFVWAWLRDKWGNYLLKPIKKEEIIEAKAHYLGSLDSKFVLTLKEEYKNLGSRKATMANFQNPDIVKNGDIFIIETPNNIIYGSVTDKENNLAIVVDTKRKRVRRVNYLKESEGENIIFFSKDNKLSDNFFFSILSNLWNVQAIDITEKLPDPTKYTRVEYVISPEADESKMNELLPNSLYTQVGNYVSVDYSANKEIRTDQILKLLGLNPSTHALFVKKNTENELERNYENAGLRKIEYFDNIDKKFLKEEGLFPGAYFSVYTENNIDWNIYRIEKVDTNKNLVYARLYKINDQGDIIMSEKSFNIDTLVSPKVGQKHTPGSIARYYIQKGSNNFSKIVLEANKGIKESQAKKVSQKQINRVQKKIETAFKDLNIPIVYSEETFKHGQKAKFEINEEGLSHIMINSNLGGPEDLVHEALHVFLTALRYKYPEVYNRLMESVPETNKEKSLLEKEEAFLRAISKNGLEEYTGDFLATGKIGDFIEALQVAGEFLAGENIKKRKTVSEILSTRISDFIGVVEDNSHPLFNLNLAQVEPMFRRWMEENEILLNCK